MNKEQFFNPGFQAHAAFINHVENSRTNMQEKYTAQVIPTKLSNNPYILTPEAVQVAEDEDQFKNYAKETTTVLYHNHNVLVIYLHESKTIKTYYIPDYRNASGASYSLKYVAQGTLKKGDLLYSYAPMDIKNKIPKIGYRTSVAWAPFFGFTTEDAIVISESFAKRARTVIHEKLFIPITAQFRYFKQFEGEKFIPEIGTYVSKENGVYKYLNIEEGGSLESLALDISEHESKIFSKAFAPKNDGFITKVKVHKIHDAELGDELNINQKIFDELEAAYQEQHKKVEEDLNEKLKMIPEEPRNQLIKGIMNTHIFIKRMSKNALTNRIKSFFDDINLMNINYILELDIVHESYTQFGDKFSTLYAGKGTISLIVPDELMPKDKNGKPFDIWLNPLSVFGRNNWGVIFETATGKIIEDIEKHVREDNKEAVLQRIEFLINNFYSKEYPEIVEQAKELLDQISENWESWKQDILENGFYLYGRAFTRFSYNEFFKEVIKKYEELFGVNLVRKDKVTFSENLFKYLQSIGLDSGCIEPDGDIEAEIFTGQNYILKLYHTADSKYNAVSVVGKYNVNGQPARGRSAGGASGAGGGVHYSWQTLGALISGGALDIVKEMWTIKSDTLEQKVPFMARVIGDGRYELKNRYKSKTKDTVNVYLKMVGLKFE